MSIRSAGRALAGVRHSLGDAAQAGVDRLTDEVGGPARRRVVLLLACVLGLDAADKGAVGAVALPLEHALHIGNTDIGLMVTVSSLVGAAATIPVGSLTDRSRRVRLLWISIVVWAVAEAGSGIAGSFPLLIAARVGLGAVTATAGPTVASLTGDFFPAQDRGRMYGFILTGELVGAGAGIVVAGGVAGVLGWRWAFLALSVPSVALAWAVRRYLPEPARGGQSRLPSGATDIRSVEDVEARLDTRGADRGAPGRADDLVRREIRRQGIAPAEEIVTDEDPAAMSLWQAVRYVLRVRTNIILILSSSLGYFFFAGLRTFAVIFLRGQYGLGEASASLVLIAVGAGALVGVVVAGDVGDRIVRRGRIDGRLVVGTVGFVAAAVTLVPALLSPLLYVSLPLFLLAAACVAAPNPALDAARLDVMPARMWGRAEGVRTVLRQSMEAFAPLLFGIVSQLLGGGHVGLAAGVAAKHAVVTARETRGLQLTFLLMLVPLIGAGVVLVGARHSYPVDVASAGESDRRVREREDA